MPKKSDTQELAKATADALLQEGIRPTQQNVRERMGSGSITTINKALNIWWQELGERMKANTSHPMLPDPVAESASKLWLQAIAYAEKRLESRRLDLEREYKKKIKDSALASSSDNEELKELRSQCIRLLKENESISEQKLSLQSKVFEQESVIIALQTQNDSLGRDLKQAQVVSGGSSSSNLDAYIEIQVASRTLKEENKRLTKQLDVMATEKSQLLIENMKLAEQIRVLKDGSD